MAPRMRELVHSQAQKRNCSSLKYFEAPVTIAVGGMDIDIGFLMKLRKFIMDECMVGLCSMEFGGALTCKQIQMVVKDNFSSLPMWNKKIMICLGWDESPPTGHVVLCKRLRGEGLHTFKGILHAR